MMLLIGMHHDIRTSKANTNARILLVRHGRTHWNLQRRRQGREDIPLDDVGREAAEALRVQLTKVEIDAIYSSPLSRARDTAEPTAREHGLPIIVDDDLLELDFGSFSGTSRAEAEVRLRKDYLHSPLPEGESLSDAWNRAERFVARVIPDLRAGRTVLVVGHKRLNRLLLGVLKEQTLEEAAADNSYRPEPGSVLDLHLSVDNNQLRILSTEGVLHAHDSG
jgi:broad specificity phosphatase PhoE